GAGGTGPGPRPWTRAIRGRRRRPAVAAGAGRHRRSLLASRDGDVPAAVADSPGGDVSGSISRRDGDADTLAADRARGTCVPPLPLDLPEDSRGPAILLRRRLRAGISREESALASLLAGAGGHLACNGVVTEPASGAA